MEYDAQSMDQFLSGIASGSVAPAGGTAAAVCGAIGTALCEMVCIHGLNHGDLAGDRDLVSAARDELAADRDRLLVLGNEDADLVDELFGGATVDLDEADAKRAIGIPLAVADTCRDVLETTTAVTVAVPGPVAVDAGTGAFLVRAALDASLFTVRHNADLVDDPEFLAGLDRRVSDIETVAGTAFDRTMEELEPPQ